MSSPEFPRFYPILDVGTLRRISGVDGGATVVGRAARIFFTAGVGILQLRAKDSDPQKTLAYSTTVKQARKTVGSTCKLILNDRPDLAQLAEFDGCHLGQEDLSISGTRRILPSPKMLGLSTHVATQLEASARTSADYVAIGPIFATTNKQDSGPVVGLEALRELRKLTTKPLVAIGGITRANAGSVLDAGADSVAVIGDMFVGCTGANLETELAENVRDFLARIL
jgi:thiamine-phosphate pyrophosphorylase